MADDYSNYPIRDAEFVRAEALGEPGQRRFRIVIVTLGDTYILWLEKQQVQALGIAIDQLFESLPSRPMSGLDMSIVPDEETLHQFRVGKIEIAFDEGSEQIILVAHDIESDGESQPVVAVRITRDVANAISEQANELMSQGRPMCPMCGSPMDVGVAHVCPEQNGHLPFSLDDDDFWVE